MPKRPIQLRLLGEQLATTPTSCNVLVVCQLGPRHLESSALAQLYYAVFCDCRHLSPAQDPVMEQSHESLTDVPAGQRTVVGTQRISSAGQGMLRAEMHW